MNRRRSAAFFLIAAILFPGGALADGGGRERADVRAGTFADVGAGGFADVRAGAFADSRAERFLPRARPGLDRPAYLRFQGAAVEDSLAIAGEPVREPKRRTYARSGAKTGAIIGGVGGAAFLVFVGILAENLCEYDCGDISAPGWVGLALFGGGVGAGAGALLGGGVGAGAGALLGGVLGATIPADAERGTPPPPAEAEGEEGGGTEGTGGGEGPSPSPSRPPTTGPRRFIASVNVQPGVGFFTERPGTPAEFTLRASLLAQLKPWFAFGPEVTHSELSGGFTAVEGAIQVGPSRHAVYPYLVGDMGLHLWKTGLYDTSVSLVGAGIGAGLSWAPRGGRWRLGVESRYHWSPQSIEDPERYRFVNVGGTARVSW